MTIDGEFSLYKKSIKVIADGVEHDISAKIPRHIWRVGVGENINNLNNPLINWGIRRQLAKNATKVMRKLLSREDIFVRC